MPSLLVSSVEVKWPENINLGELDDALQENLKEIATKVEYYAKTTGAFKDETGELRRSIGKHKVRGGYRVEAKARHSHLVEKGHAQVTKTGRTVGYVPAHPFLYPARERAVSEFIASIGWIQGSARAGSFTG